MYHQKIKFWFFGLEFFFYLSLTYTDEGYMEKDLHTIQERIYGMHLLKEEVCTSYN